MGMYQRPRAVTGAVVSFAMVIGGAGAAHAAEVDLSMPVGSIEIPELGAAASAIYGFGFSVTNVMAPPTGRGGRAGRVEVSEVAVVRLPDTLSPLLFRDAVQGTHLPAVQIVVPPSADTGAEASYILRDVVISGFSNDNGVESVSFSYSSIEMLVGGTRVCYDIATATSC